LSLSDDNSTTKKCNACGALVSVDILKKCPECGEEKGFAIAVTLNESVNIDDYKKAEKKAIVNAHNSAVDFYDRTLASLNEDKKLKKTFQRILSNLHSKMSEYEKYAEQRAEERYAEAKEKGETKKIQFSVDTIVGTEEQRKIKELEDLLESEKKKNIELQAEKDAQRIFSDELNELKKIIEDQGETIRDIRSRMSPKQTVGLAFVLGLTASFIGSALFSLYVDLGKTLVENPLILNFTG